VTLPSAIFGASDSMAADNAGVLVSEPANRPARAPASKSSAVPSAATPAVMRPNSTATPTSTRAPPRRSSARNEGPEARPMV